MSKRTTFYRWLFLMLPLYAGFAFGRSSWPMVAAFAVGIVVYNVTMGLAARRWPEWVRSRALFLRCVEIGLVCIGLSLIYLKGRYATLFEFYYDGFYAVPVIFAATAAGRRGLFWAVLAATAAVAFGQVVIAPDPGVVWHGVDYWLGVGAYSGIYAAFFGTVGGLALFVREYGSREQRDLVLRLARSFVGLRDAVLILDPAGRIMSMNPTAESLFGRRVHQVFSRPVEELCPGLRLVDEDGLGVASSEPIELTVPRGPGGRQGEFPCEVLASAYRVEDELAAYVLVARDLTSRREIEGELAQQSRLATFGRLASGVAHDVANPLAGIRALADVMLEGDRPEHEAEALGLIRAEADRVAGMLREILDFVRADRAPRTVVALNEVVERALRLRSYASQEEGIEIVRELAEPSPRAFGNSAQLEQIVLNLVTNAEQALAGRGGGEVVVRTRYEGDRARFEVIDSGPGIPADFIDRIFDPFFTTKAAGKGTGLGLSIARDIVREHGGELRVRSRSGEGARFVVDLPAHTGPGLLVPADEANVARRTA